MEAAYPAPIGGWNARDPLDMMEPTDAVELVNWFPDSGAVRTRGGSILKLNIANAPVETLCNFTGGTNNKLIAACNAHLWDVTNLSSATSLGSGYTNDRWQYAHFAGKVVFCNGADMPQVYDGTAVSAMVAGLMGTVAITSISTATAGGTLAAATYGYKITYLFGTTESTPSAEATKVTTGATSTVTLNFSPPSYSTGTKVYGRTSGGAWLLMATLAAGVATFTDDGSITPSGTIPSTDTTPKNLLGAMNFKGRAIYWANQTCGFWYAIAGGYQGALTYFPLDTVFQRGGYVVLVVSWSRDNGDGVDDMAAFISSNGEILVYQGTDPSDVTRWSLVGRFNIGRPLAVRGHGKIASQEIVLTMDGFFSMDEAIANQRTEESLSFSGKIIRAANSAVQEYQGNYGWSCLNYPRGQMFLVNVPVSSDESQYEQYVRNTNTGAWCRFTGWNAITFCVFSDRLYFGDKSGNVWLADTNSNDTQYGYGDNNNAVTKIATQAFMRFTQPGMKTKMNAVQLVTNMYRPTRANLNVFQDYAIRPLPGVVQADSYPTTYWDTSQWDTFYWGDPDYDFLNVNAKPTMHSVGGYGFALAISYRYNSRAQMVVWYSTNFVFDNAGV